MSQIRINALRFPGAAQEIELPEGKTLQSFLTSRGWELRESEVASINGLVAKPDQILKDCDRVVLSMGARGEFTVRRAGIWRLHKYDPDCVWPSDCHAHNIDDPREVLDLYTGHIFDTNTRNKIRKLSKKDLIYVKDQFLCR